VSLNTGLEESQALRAIEELLRAGFLDRLALCAQCKQRWVFRQRKKDRFCKRQCRQNWYEQTSRRKEDRKGYFRKRYREEKERNKREQERVRRKLK
jgi:hypothetical protein